MSSLSISSAMLSIELRSISYKMIELKSHGMKQPGRF